MQEHVCNIHGIVTMLLVCTAYSIENFPSLVIRTKYEKKMYDSIQCNATQIVHIVYSGFIVNQGVRPLPFEPI